MRGVELLDVDIHGEIDNLTVNGVGIGPWSTPSSTGAIPTGPRCPADPAGFREAWDILERLWRGTVERARRLRPELLLHESADGGWSTAILGLARTLTGTQ
jgi:hypothetical protein